MKSCKKQTEIIEKSKITKLSFKEVVSLKFHLLMCSSCTSYKKLSDQLDTILTNSFSVKDNKGLSEMKMSKDGKQKLIDLLKE